MTKENYSIHKGYNILDITQEKPWSDKNNAHILKQNKYEYIKKWTVVLLI